MPTLEASGTQTATLTTEHVLNSGAFTGNKIYVLVVDAAALANGETLELRAYYTCLTAGTERLMWYSTYVHAQSEDMIMSAPIPSDISVKFTLEQNGGTGRAFPWKVLSL